MRMQLGVSPCHESNGRAIDGRVLRGGASCSRERTGGADTPRLTATVQPANPDARCHS